MYVDKWLGGVRAKRAKATHDEHYAVGFDDAWDAATIRVNAHWNFGARNSYTSSFVVVRRAGSWFVDDEYLAGQPSIDIFSEGTASPCH
jgi:hypothetical protein